MTFLGIDPGVSGAIAAVHDNAVEVMTNKNTEHDLAEWLRAGSYVFALIERVSSSPQMGVRSAFTFGQSYGFLRGLLVANAIPFEDITPFKWQTAMRCRSGGDKNVTKAAAQRLQPHLRITHATADAVLLAELAKRKWYERNPSS